MKLGWLNVEVVSKSGVYRLKNVEQTGQALLMYDPRRGPGEYFLLENRWRGASYDAGAGRAGRGIRDEGLAVWHILEDPELWKKLRPPIGGVREWGRRGIRLIRANGGDPLDDRTALFDKKGTVLSDESRPAHLHWLDGTQSGLRVELLSSGGSAMRVRVNSPGD